MQPPASAPAPLPAPVLNVVRQIGPMGLHVEWSYDTAPVDFQRFEVQQRANGAWQTLATLTDPAARSFDGGPVAYMDAAHPVRVVVFNAAGESAASNERTIALL